jgi:hypothetical protein
VSLDLVRNCPIPDDPPYVMSGAFWIALAVRANTVVRGVQLANQLRREVGDMFRRGVQLANQLWREVKLAINFRWLRFFYSDFVASIK